jgi:hypothetical protein
MNVQFYQLTLGAGFEWRGKRYRKEAMSMAHDEERGWCHIFMGHVEVVSDGPLLPPEIAAEWKPDWGVWTAWWRDERQSSSETGARGGAVGYVGPVVRLAW